MTNSKANILELAKQGNPGAIATLINRQLQPKGITAKAAFKGNSLQIILESKQAPAQAVLVDFVRKGLLGLAIESVKTARVYGKHIGEDFSDWQQDIDLISPGSESAVMKVAGSGELEPKPIPSELPATDLPGLELNNNTGQDGSIWNSFFGTVAGATGAVSSAATFAGGAVAGAAAGTVGAVGNAATQAGGAIASTVVGAAQTAGSAALQATDGIGYVIHMISGSPQLQELTKAVQVDWLLAIIDRVDVVKAEKRVKQLQRQYPGEKPSEIAHRIMVEKALYVGGSGFASSLVPGFAAGMFAADLAATTALQAEMGYQIACAYGLDLNHPARKGEILGIFGLALGGGYAVKAGLGLLRNAPMVGAAIGASSNAAMLYAVGYAACQFYEAKANPLASDAAIANSQAESEAFMKDALKQQAIMDQILVHVILAGHPGKTWQQILPELPKLNLSPVSLQVISQNIQSPPSLEALLNLLSHDFAVPLVAQCQKVVEMDGVTTPEEAKVLKTIADKFSVEIALLKNQGAIAAPPDSRQKLFGLF